MGPKMWKFIRCLFASQDKLQRIINKECKYRTNKIDISGLNLKDLSRISHMFWLKEINCSNNQIVSIVPIRLFRKLTVLNLNGNQIESLEPIKGFSDLKSLSFDKNQVENIGPIGELDNLGSLSFNDNKVTSIAPVKNLKRLTKLSFNNNKVNKLDNMKDLSELTSLSFNKNQVEKIDDLKDLKNLVELDCSSNQIENVDSFKNLIKLENLNFSNNKVTSIKNLASLNNLTKLDFSNNKVIKLDALKGLTKLKTFNCSKNAVADLEPIKNSINLTDFNCSNNYLTNIDTVTNFKKLIKLSFSDNAIRSIASLKELKNIEYLECSNNPIKDFKVIFDLKSLENLIYQTNDNKTGIPDEDLSTDDDKNCLARLMFYYNNKEIEKANDEKDGDELLKQYKIIILGNSKAGKTQLANFLFNKGFDSEVINHDINIEKGKIKLSDNEEIEARVWDFGQRDIHYGTNMIYMRTQAVFIICWNSELENNDCYKIDGNEYCNYPLQYWTNAVKKYSVLGSPFIIVETKCDDGKPSMNYPKHSDAMSDFCFSAKTNKNGDFLKQSISKAFKKIVTTQVIKKSQGKIIKKFEDWNLENKDMPLAIRKNYKISQKDFLKLCKDNGKISDTDALLKILYQIGVVFYDENISDEIIIDQQWLLNAIYKIFEPSNKLNEIIKINGFFSLTNLQDSVWKKYTYDEQKYLLALMIQCNIVIEFLKGFEFNNFYILPDLLQDKSVSERFIERHKSIKENPVDLEILFDCLHHDFIRKLISEICKIGFDMPLFWNGVALLSKTASAMCLIEYDFNKGKTCGFISIKTKMSEKEQFSNYIKHIITNLADKNNLPCMLYDKTIRPKKKKDEE